MKLGFFLLAAIPFGTLGFAGVAFLTPPDEVPAPPWFAVVQLEKLSVDGAPVRVPVCLKKRDRWNRLVFEQTLGHVFVRRLGDDQVLVLRAEHHGTFRIPVDYDPDGRLFRSRCWKMSFDLAGKTLDFGDELTALPARVERGKVLVRYQPPDPREE